MANDSYLSGSDLQDFKNQSLYANGYPSLRRSAQPPAIANPTAYSGTPLAPAAAANPAPTFAIPDAGSIDNYATYKDAANAGNAAAVSAANAVAKTARTGGGVLPNGDARFDPGTGLPSALSALRNPLDTSGSSSLLTPDANPSGVLTRSPQPVTAATPVATSATPAARAGSLVAAAAPVITGAQPGLTRTAPDGTPVSASGHPLGYGQVINGVPTFSDGSGTGAIPRTMSDDQIKSLGNNVNTIPDANFVNPGAGTNGVTPVLGSLNRTFASNDPRVAADNAEIDREQAERNAKSDVASILNEDPRSSMGIAARNARISLANIKGNRTGRYTNGQSPYESAIQDLIGTATAPITGATGAATRSNSYATDALNQEGENTRQGMRNDAENTRSSAELSRKLDQYQTDPTTGAVTLLRSGVASPVVDATGKPFSVSQNPNKVTPEITKVANDIYGGLPDKDAQGNPIPDEQRWNTALQRASGQTSAPAKAGAGQPPQAAIDMLKKNPSLKSQFDAKYGKGYSDRVLSNS